MRDPKAGRLGEERVAPTRSGVDPSGFSALSPREWQVLSFASAGLLDKQIAPELGISPNTLRTYWTRIRSKLGETSRSALAVAYFGQLSSSAPDEPFEPDWEIDLETWMWRRLTSRPLPLTAVESRTEVSVDELLTWFTPQDQARLRSLINNLAEQKVDHIAYSAQAITPSGPITTSALVRSVRDEDGGVRKLLGRHMPVWALEQQERTDHGELQHKGWVFDVETGLVLAADSVNDQHGFLRGIPHPQADYGRIFFDEDFAAGMREQADVIAGRLETCSYLLRTKASGGLEQITITAHGVKNSQGKVIKVIGFRTTTRLLSAAHDERLAASLKIGFWAKDLRSGTYFQPDEVFCEIFRVDPKSKTLDEDIRSRYRKQDLADAYDFVDKAIEAGESRKSRDFQLVFEDGSSRWIRLEVYVERDSQGPLRVTGSVVAIS